MDPELSWSIVIALSSVLKSKSSKASGKMFFKLAAVAENSNATCVESGEQRSNVPETVVSATSIIVVQRTLGSVLTKIRGASCLLATCIAAV